MACCLYEPKQEFEDFNDYHLPSNPNEYIDGRGRLTYKTSYQDEYISDDEDVSAAVKNENSLGTEKKENLAGRKREIEAEDIALDDNDSSVDGSDSGDDDDDDVPTPRGFKPKRNERNEVFYTNKRKKVYWEVEKVLDRRINSKNKIEYFVKFIDCGDEDNEWVCNQKTFAHAIKVYEKSLGADRKKKTE